MLPAALAAIAVLVPAALAAIAVLLPAALAAVALLPTRRLRYCLLLSAAVCCCLLPTPAVSVYFLTGSDDGRTSDPNWGRFEKVRHHRVDSVG